MEINVRLSFDESDGPQLHAAAYRWILRALAIWNYAMLRRWALPKIYSSGVRYGIPGEQDFPDAKAIKRRGWADCGPLSCWRVAELWSEGERGPYPFAPWIGGADFRIYSRPVQGGRRLYHCQVRRGARGGRAIEDPSRLLGMKAVA